MTHQFITLNTLTQNLETVPVVVNLDFVSYITPATFNETEALGFHMLRGEKFFIKADEAAKALLVSILTK